MAQRYIGLDFETYCDLDLTVVGLDRYVNHRSFTVLLAGLENETSRDVLDFIKDPVDAATKLANAVKNGWTFVASNAAFERACLRRLGHDIPDRVIDSAVHARMYGGSSKLEYAARQFTRTTKLESGLALIKLFSIPNEHNHWSCPTPFMVEGFSHEWYNFGEYCANDALAGLSVTINTVTVHDLNERSSRASIETAFELLTYQMNERGWPVDIPLVKEMKRQYERNLEDLTAGFRQAIDPEGKLNLNSPVQLQKWAAERGVKMKSFKSEAVDTMLPKIREKLKSMETLHPRFEDYFQVMRLLEVKQELGGTALKKLDVILNTVGEDGRLRHQYMHVGAGQSYRTSGRGVQMQNLKRLGQNMIQNMDDVHNLSFDNETLGENLRQVFTSSHPQGQLIVGDFSSVESRGLAWLAGADWKIKAFKAGKDMYKVAASGIFNVSYKDVTKDQRQVGKVAELSCGYQGGPNAVERFAGIYGLDMPEPMRVKLVADWREDNPEIEGMWAAIDTALHAVVEAAMVKRVYLGNGLNLEFRRIATPFSLTALHPGAQSVEMVLENRFGRILLQRIFQGCYIRGRNVNIYKPGETKAGPAWSGYFIDPATKKQRYYDIYGGKITGILTQSMCREMFFEALEQLSLQERAYSNWDIIGQFHDEIVVDWRPPESAPEGTQTSTLEETLKIVEHSMQYVSPAFNGFPLEADIKHDYRYIK